MKFQNTTAISPKANLLTLSDANVSFCALHHQLIVEQFLAEFRQHRMAAFQRQ